MKITLAHLRAAGFTEAQILRVVEMADTEQSERRLKGNREAARKYRAHHQNHDDKHFHDDGADVRAEEVSKKEVSKKEPLAKAKGRSAPVNQERTALYDLGKQLLGPSAGGQITRLLNRMGGSVDRALAILHNAKAAGDPARYVGAVVRGPPPTHEQDTDQLVLAWCIKNGVGGCEALEIPFILEDMNGGKPYRRPARANGHNS